MPPAGGETSNRNGRLIQQLFNWADADGTEPLTLLVYKLPNGADCSPDAAWVKQKLWDTLTLHKKKRDLSLFALTAFVMIVSPSDSLKIAQEKMRRYRQWYSLAVTNRKSRQVEIYRPGQEVEVLESPATLSGETILPDLS